MLFEGNLKLKGLYKPAESIAILERIINGGTDIYVSHILLADVLLEQKNKAKAAKVLTSANDELEFRLAQECKAEKVEIKKLHEKRCIPSELWVENNIFLSQIKSRIKNL